jgi:hypothetical protein
MRRVAILVAASPTTAFYSQVAALRLAVQRLRWSRWEPSLHLYTGGPYDPAELEEWRPHLDGVELHWSSAARFALDGDWAQSDDVFASAPPHADVLMAMDADTFPVDALESVVEEVCEAGVIAGVVAHYPPFPQGQEATSAPSIRDAWRQLSQGLLDAPLDFSHSHTLMGAEIQPELRAAPFYLNFGVVFFRRDVFRRIGPLYLAIRPQLMKRMHFPDFSGQVALTLAISAERSKTLALPMRYNFPNDPIAERMYPTELEHAVVFHYLRTSAFDRHQIFATAKQYEKFLALYLEGVDRRFQDAVRTIIGERYPFV